MEASFLISFNTKEKKELLDALKMRQWLYNFLGYCFFHSHNREGFHRRFELNLLLQLGDAMPQFKEGIDSIIEGLPDYNSWNEFKWDEIHFEHQRLFIGPNKLPAPPWSSVYLGEEKIIFDEHTLKVRDFYRRWSLEPVEIKKIPDDHIGLELEFISVLIGETITFLKQEQIDKANEALSDQEIFLDEYILTWVWDYCFLLKEASQHPLYKGLALFTPSYLELDREVLREIKASVAELWLK